MENQPKRQPNEAKRRQLSPRIREHRHPSKMDQATKKSRVVFIQRCILQVLLNYIGHHLVPTYPTNKIYPIQLKVFSVALRPPQRLIDIHLLPNYAICLISPSSLWGYNVSYLRKWRTRMAIKFPGKSVLHCSWFILGLLLLESIHSTINVRIQFPHGRCKSRWNPTHIPWYFAHQNFLEEATIWIWIVCGSIAGELGWETPSWI